VDVVKGCYQQWSRRNQGKGGAKRKERPAIVERELVLLGLERRIVVKG
jgi:hypothetical protein